MSRKKKKMMTPAEVAQQLAAYIAKQEETLRRYPVGPLANSAKLNMKKGKSALAALQGKNEEMRVGKQPAAPMQMEPGGPTFELGLRNLNPGNIRSWGSKPVKDGFAQFETLDEGWAALQKQLERYQGKLSKPSQTGITGDSTLAQAMAKYAPHFENDTAGYIDRLVDYLGRGGVEGISADTKIKDIPTDKWASAIALVESPQGYAALESAGLLNEEVASALANDTAVVKNRDVVPQFLETNPTAFGTQSPALPDNRNPQPKAPRTERQNILTPLQDTPDFMLTPQAQAEKRGEEYIPEGQPNVAQANPQLAQEREGMDLAGLDFNAARAVETGKNVPGSNITYARNEFGDYNVIVPDKAFGELSGGYGRVGSSGFTGSYVIKAKDWKGPDQIEQSLTNAIPYVQDVDGAATEGDKASLFASVFADPSGQNMSLDLDAMMVASTIGGGESSTLQSGMGMTFKEVAELVAEQEGIKPPKKVAQRMSGDMGKSFTTYVTDPDDLKRYNKEMQGIYADIAANPGTYRFTDEEGNERVGVGGYSPFSDYVAYNTGDVDFQTRFQNRQQTYGLAGQFIAPGAVTAARGAAVSRGAAGLGRSLSDDAVVALQTGDDAALNLAVAQETKLLGQGQKMLPQGSAGPAVKGVPGMKFKPGTGAQGQAPTYVPARNAAGRTIDITPVSTTKTGALTARQQIQQSGVNVLDDGAGGILGVQRGQFRFPAGSAGGKGGQFGGVQPGGLSLPGSRLPAVRNVGLQTTRQGTTALAPINPMTGLPARTAMQTQTLGLADDAMSAIPTIERASGIGGSIFTRTPFALERLAGQAGMTYLPQFDDRILRDPETGAADLTQDVLEDGIDVGGGGGDKPTDPTGGEEKTNDIVPPQETPTKDFEMQGPDKINLDMGKPSPLMAIPGLASLASAGIQRRALNEMEGPARPELNRIANFDYRSNVGQQLMDAREASRAAGANTNLQGTQQAALAQSLNTQRLQQEARIRQTDEQMRQQALNRYENIANQTRNLNTAMLNKYQQDSRNFDNAMTQAQAAVRQQPLQVIGSAAQDYLKNIYQTNMANTLEGIGRQFDTTGMAGNQGGQQQNAGGQMVPIYDAAGNITGYRQQ